MWVEMFNAVFLAEFGEIPCRALRVHGLGCRAIEMPVTAMVFGLFAFLAFALVFEEY